MNHCSLTRFATLIATLATISFAQLRAFPSAEGFGRNTTGGRGGAVYHVTTLADKGPGSFRDAVTSPNRIVVFDVGGVIRLETAILVSPNLTIAGQTAPGGGITVYGGSMNYGRASNTITRHIRYRLGTKLKVNQLPPTDAASLAAYNDDGSDALSVTTGTHMMFDHVSVSWGRDGTFDINTNFTTRIIDSITVQNSIISQGLQSHSTGGLLQSSGHVSILRTLYANNWTRNPKVTCNNQFVNNVLYNWGASSYNFGGYDMATKSNVTNNYFISGPGGTRPGIMGGDSFVSAYFNGNVWDSNRDGVLNGTIFTAYSDSIKQATQPFAYPALAKEFTAIEAYQNILKSAGASLHRDQVDSIVFADVTSLGKAGIFIRTEDTLSSHGPGIVASGTAPIDTDKDGMPDMWETWNSLNPNDATDGSKTGLSVDGYTNVEMYLNELAGDVVRYKNRAPKGISLSATSIAENKAVNSTVGLLTSSDPDASNTFTYTLVAGTGSTDNGKFNISANALRSGALFDFETKTSYAVRIRSTDQGGLYTEQAYTIRVTDVYEPLPSSSSKPLSSSVTLPSSSSYMAPSSSSISVSSSSAAPTPLANLLVSPNPILATGNLYYNWTPSILPGRINFQVMDIRGIVVRNFDEQNVHAGANQTWVKDCHQLANGNYFVKAIVNGVVIGSTVFLKR